MLKILLDYFKTNVRNIIAVGLVTAVGTFAAPHTELLKGVCIDVVTKIEAAAVNPAE